MRSRGWASRSGITWIDKSVIMLRWPHLLTPSNTFAQLLMQSFCSLSLGSHATPPCLQRSTNLLPCIQRTGEHNPSEDSPADVQIYPRCRSSCVFCGLAGQFVSPRRPLNVYTILVNTQQGVSVLCSSQNLFKRGIMFQHN